MTLNLELQISFSELKRIIKSWKSKVGWLAVLPVNESYSSPVLTMGWYVYDKRKERHYIEH